METAGTSAAKVRIRLSVCALVLISITVTIRGAFPDGAGADYPVGERAVVSLDAPALQGGWAYNLDLEHDPDGSRLVGCADPGVATRVSIAESLPRPMPWPVVVDEVTLDADTPQRTAASIEVRGWVRERWTEWSQPGSLMTLDGATKLQTRLTLSCALDGTSPRVSAATIRSSRAEVRAANLQQAIPPTSKVWATRIGLVGGTTANGHVISERDRFVALPSQRALNRLGGTDYRVQISYNGRTTLVPVWDTGPWNVRDDYWNEPREAFSDLPRWTSQAEAAFFSGYNAGRDGMGRTVTIPTSIDIADGTFWDDLGMTQSDWVDATFLWLIAPQPPPKPTPVITPKPTIAPSAPSPGGAPKRAASHTGIVPAQRVHLPLILNGVEGWTTQWTIQNVTDAWATGSTQIYHGTGQRAGEIVFTLPPFGSTTYAPSDLAGLPSGFTGSGVVAATQAVAVLVSGDKGDADRFSYEGVANGNGAVSLPLLFKGSNGWTSGVQVQNLGPAPALVQLSLPALAQNQSAEPQSIPPMASRTFYLPSMATVPQGYVGSGLVHALGGEPLAAVVNTVRGDGSAMAYAGTSGGTEWLEAPLLMKRYNGWSTGLHVLNASPTAGSVAVRYRGAAPSPISPIDTAPLNAGGGQTFYQPAQQALPDGFAGSASIVGSPGTRLLGIVSAVQEGNGAMAYAAGQPDSPLVAAPRVVKDADGWDSAIQVENSSSLPTVVSLTLSDEDGSRAFHTDEPMPPGASRTYYLPAIGELQSGFRGSALVTSTTPGHPGLGVVVNTAAKQ